MKIEVLTRSNLLSGEDLSEYLYYKDSDGIVIEVPRWVFRAEELRRIENPESEISDFQVIFTILVYTIFIVGVTALVAVEYFS